MHTKAKMKSPYLLKLSFVVITMALGVGLLSGLVGLGAGFNILKLFFEQGDMTPILHAGHIGIISGIVGFVAGGSISGFIFWFNGDALAKREKWLAQQDRQTTDN